MFYHMYLALSLCRSLPFCFFTSLNRNLFHYHLFLSATLSSTYKYISLHRRNFICTDVRSLFLLCIYPFASCSECMVVGRNSSLVTCSLKLVSMESLHMDALNYFPAGMNMIKHNQRITLLNYKRSHIKGFLFR